MTTPFLTQSEADALIAIEKHRDSDKKWDYPLPGQKIMVPLISFNGREAFSLDIARGRIDLSKHTFQNRARSMVVLVRLDLSGRPHKNPDGEDIPVPHLHIFREGFGDKWAIPPPKEYFGNLADIVQTLDDFMGFCNITLKPLIKENLFV